MINSYVFIDALCKALPEDAIVVCGMGTAFTGTYQSAKMKRGQRWVTASGEAPMGYGLPGAIGAHYATGKHVVCLEGDGGLQVNAQELATIARHSLPITIFVFNNAGYLAIKHTCMNHFGRMAGCDYDSGLGMPDFVALANAYGIPAAKVKELEMVPAMISATIQTDGPWLFDVEMPPMQPLLPRSTSLKRPDGSIVSKPIEDMFPFLNREEFKAQMSVPMVEVLG